MEATAKSLSKGRKKRQPPAGYADADAITSYTPRGTHATHAAGPVCLDAHASEPLLASGGSDGVIAILETNGGTPAIKTSIKGVNAKHVHAVRLHPMRPLVISAHADGTARVSSTETGEGVHTIAAHGCSANGEHVTKANAASANGFSCVRMRSDRHHPASNGRVCGKCLIRPHMGTA